MILSFASYFQLMRLKSAMIFFSTFAFIALSICFLADFCIADNEVDIFHYNTIHWYYADFPPVTVPTGPDAGKGFFDKVNQLLVENMEEYEHVFVLANYQRIIRELEREQYGCCVALYKTPEREKFIHFSIPALVVLPNGLVIRRGDEKRFSNHINDSGRISLESVLEDPSIKLGISEGRKYSGGLDEILEQNRDNKNVIRRVGPDVFKGLLEMLFVGHVDCIIGYPVEAEYLAKQSGSDGETRFFSVEETNVQYTLGYVGCPKNEWGKRVIESVNELLYSHRHTEEYLAFYEYWLDNETRTLYRNIAKKFYENDSDNQNDK